MNIHSVDIAVIGQVPAGINLLWSSFSVYMKGMTDYNYNRLSILCPLDGDVHGD